MDKKKALITLSAIALGTAAYQLFRPIRSKVQAVQPFDLNRYLGKWYEIARMDYFWEEGLEDVTAEYSLLPDASGIHIKNQGRHYLTNKIKSYSGKAKFLNGEDTASLKVRFFGLINAGYHIVQLDPDYQHALVFGDNLDYMWILCREKKADHGRVEEFLTYAKDHGYNTEKLVFTKQS